MINVSILYGRRQGISVINVSYYMKAAGLFKAGFASWLTLQLKMQE